MIPAPNLLQQAGSTGMVRLRTLVIVRWLAILGQSITVLIASQVLDLQINTGLCFLAIGMCATTNLVAGSIYPRNRRMAEREILGVLVFDVCQLASLLYLTGGLNNPFALMILAPVTVSAMTLRLPETLFTGAVALLVVTVLALTYVPLQAVEGTVLEMPDIFIVGEWVALVIGVGFLALYARRVTSETNAMSQALLATQMALSREQQLTALGGVVAAAAHELGTPLATIKLASGELLDELEDRPELREDAALIREQADRCRDILRSMGRVGKDDLMLRQAPLLAVIEEAAEPHQDRGIAIEFTCAPSPDAPQRMPTIQRWPEIIHGLRNLIQNAVDFAQSTVWVDAKWSDDVISVRVIDDGNGYPVDLLGRIGDPFVRRRAQRERDDMRPEYEGMGLGLFIAKTLLERSGAEVTFANGSASAATRPDNRGGAIAEITWPTPRLMPANPDQGEGLGDNQPIEI